MPNIIFFPYFFADESLDLEISDVNLDGKSISPIEIVNAESCQAVLFGLEEWDKLTLTLIIADTNKQLVNALQEDEELETVADLYVVTKDKKGRIRESFLLSTDGSGVWVGDIDFLRDDHFGTISIQAFLVRKIDGGCQERRADLSGERIASTAEWKIYIDEKASMPGGSMDGEWLEFESDERAALSSRSDCAYYLDLSDDSQPKLYLNSGIEGLRRAFELTAPHGRAAGLRDTLIHSILQPVLHSLAMSALSGKDAQSVDELDGWNRTLLLALAKQSHDLSDEMAVDRLLEYWNKGDVISVSAELNTLIQRHLSMPLAAQKMIKSMEGTFND